MFLPILPSLHHGPEQCRITVLLEQNILRACGRQWPFSLCAPGTGEKACTYVPTACVFPSAILSTHSDMHARTPPPNIPQLSHRTVGLCREVFTLHGLWVNYDTGKYPQFCTHDQFDATQVCRRSSALRLPTLLYAEQ